MLLASTGLSGLLLLYVGSNNNFPTCHLLDKGMEVPRIEAVALIPPVTHLALEVSQCARHLVNLWAKSN